MENKTWKPTTAGILSIVAGAFGVIGGILIGTIGVIAGGVLGALGLPIIGNLVAGLLAVPIALGAVAIVGGIYALKRRAWGLSLGGAICALLIPTGNVLGILAIIFVVMGKDEFE